MTFKRFIGFSICLFLVVLNTSAYACNKKTYTIGVQNIDYRPHYSFVESNNESFFGDFVDWLKQKTGCQFKIISLPIKRLNLAFEQQQAIDFIYPDNPNWHQANPAVQAKKSRFYSSTITTALGGTMVKQANQNITLPNFSILAIPRGFTPVAWLPLKQQYPIKFREVTNAKAALLMVQANRATGADIEYNVAQYLIKRHQLAPMVLANNLPFTPTGFHLSTFKQVEMIKHISELIKENQSEINKIKKKFNLIEKIP